MIDPRNGAPIAIMGGTWITNMRTGAAGGVAAKFLARKEPKILGLIGAGAQAKTQLMGLLSVYKRFEEVKVWSRTKETRERFVTEIKRLNARNISRMAHFELVEDVVQGADIIVTTTPVYRTK